MSAEPDPRRYATYDELRDARSDARYDEPDAETPEEQQARAAYEDSLRQQTTGRRKT